MKKEQMPLDEAIESSEAILWKFKLLKPHEGTCRDILKLEKRQDKGKFKKFNLAVNQLKRDKLRVMHTLADLKYKQAKMQSQGAKSS